MSTRSAIAMTSDDTIIAVYCHFDGHLIGVGDTLRRYYSTRDRVSSLLSYGSISSLCESIGEPHSFSTRPSGQTTFYCRDRGDTDASPRTFHTLHDYDSYADSFADYVYLFDSDKEEWLYRRSEEPEYCSLEDALREKYTVGTLMKHSSVARAA